jgi:hypothetical protein
VLLLIDGVKQKKGVPNSEEVGQAFCDQMANRRPRRSSILLLLRWKLLLRDLSGLLLLNESHQLTHEVFLALTHSGHILSPLLLIQKSSLLNKIFKG